VSEELVQHNLTEHGLKIGKYEFYNVPNTSLDELKRYKILPNHNYGKYRLKRTDALLVDRRNKKAIDVILTIEYKDPSEFKTVNDRKNATEQCNTICQLVGSKIGIATDNTTFIWFNPTQEDTTTQYSDFLGKTRSFTLIKESDGSEFTRRFTIDQKTDEIELTKLLPDTKASLENLNIVVQSISGNNSRIVPAEIKDPTSLAKQIWQDVWSVEGAGPERCLYTFLELFIFKYLSDLKILKDDSKGNDISFSHILSLGPEKSFKNYSSNARDYLKQLFPKSKEDGTTIINGTVLSPDVPEHGQVFYRILKRFDSFGELTNIDPAFKSKVFESYMKEDIGKKNWGRYFTPRKIVDAIIEMSDIDKLPDNSLICDPACGVGGFILEPIKVKENGLNFYYQVKGNKINSKYNFIGFDKGFHKEEQLTIILAKSNMLIFLSELLKNNLNLNEKFADLMNETFKLQTNTILGTLARTEINKYDLIMTNPPYVTSGSSNYKDAIKNDGKLKSFYKVNGIGVESLFIEWIVRSLKPERTALVIIPHGILNRLNDDKVRKMIKDECIIDALISLPINTFYTTPQKTYILIITKKPEPVDLMPKVIQKEPVFTYLVSHIGETLDVKRFEDPDNNDLPELVSLFNQFKGAKKSFKTDSKRCKIQPIEKFDADDPLCYWSVDRWWSKDEKIELGIEEGDVVMTLEEFTEKVNETLDEMKKIKQELGDLI